jgi:hypothetical protein
MFAIDCPHHGARTLASTDDVRRIDNTDHGIVLEVECWCGGIVTIVTGHHAAPAPALTNPMSTPAAPAVVETATPAPAAERLPVACGAAA